MKFGAFRTRIGSARLKGSDTRLYIMKNEVAEKTMRYLRADLKLAERDTGHNAVGYALVVWDGEGAHCTYSHVSRGVPVSVAQVPEFTKSCLTVERVDRMIRKDR